MATRRDPTATKVMALVDKLANDIDTKVADVLAGVLSELLAFAKKLDEDGVLGGADTAKAVSQVKILDDIKSMLSAADAKRLDDAVADAFGDMWAQAQQLVPLISAGFTPQARAATFRAVERALRAASVGWESEARAMARHIRRAIVGGVSLTALERELEANIGGVRARIKTRVWTALAAVHRQAVVDATKVAAKETQEVFVFVYVGAEDSLTRPFCQECVGQAWTLAALDRKNSGPHQPQPPSRYGGGWNCRHRLAPMPESLARRRGYKVNK